MQGNSTTTFNPTGTMTRAEFITVMVRAMYPEIEQQATVGNWWNKYVDKAIEEGLITSSKYNETQLQDAMPRQEMAWMMMNYINDVGAGAYSLVNTWQISDYSSIGNQYQSDVLKAYSLGLLGGKDDNGTFDPQGTMTRQEAAAVIMRMVDETKRLEVEVKNQVFEEGTLYATDAYRRTAQEGDTFVKADGTSVVLVRDKATGILGLNQGVALDDGRTIVGSNGTTFTLTSGTRTTLTNFDDAGYTQTFSGWRYYVNPYNGEGIWECQISMLSSAYRPTGTGDFYGQLSADMHFYWDALLEQWNPVATNLATVQYYNPNGLQ